MRLFHHGFPMGPPTAITTLKIASNRLVLEAQVGSLCNPHPHEPQLVHSKLCWPALSQRVIVALTATMIMATPIRKKRNFKALQLDVSQPTKPNDPEPVPTRAAPATTTVKGKKRPPPMTLNAPKLGVSNAIQDPDGNIVTTAGGLPSAPATASTNTRRNTYHTTLSNTLASLRYDLRNEDLKDLQELGQGNGGSVKKVEHTPTNMIMAKKASLFTLLDLHFLQLLHFLLDRAHRCQAFHPEADSPRTSHHA